MDVPNNSPVAGYPRKRRSQFASGLVAVALTSLVLAGSVLVPRGIARQTAAALPIGRSAVRLSRFPSPNPMTIPGASIQPSPYPVHETMDRLQAALTRKGITIYTRLDQQAELRAVGREIRPLEFLLFGNPQAGGAVLAQNPAAALDLPLKAIVWEDEHHHVWLAFNEASYLRQRYGLSASVVAPLNLSGLVASVLTPK